MFASEIDRRCALLGVLFAVGCAPSAPSATTAKKSAPPPTKPAVSPASEQPPIERPSAVPQIVYRPDDRRPKHDDERLAAVGIHRYASQRLVLYTDIAREDAAPLPPLIDKAYDALTEYFGPLPPARDGGEFQMTGYLIGDDALFREAGLIPENLPPFEHGRHRRNEFWMRDQKHDYYRRHLLIHEVTHCVTTYIPDTSAPVWYFEGIAELFGTHRLRDDGTFEWGVMPDAAENFAGLGRITLIRNDYAAGKGLTLDQVQSLPVDVYLKPEPYAWSWALCHFMARHPRYGERFREAGRHRQGREFIPWLTERFAADARDLNTEWALFTLNLQYGYDLPRSAIDFVPGTPLDDIAPSRDVEVAADRGWQSSQVRLKAGEEYAVTATGRFTLANEPKPWVSEPQGISIRYFDGYPLGRLLACIRQEDAEPDAEESMLKVLSIGQERRFTAPITGTLYLRLNDSWSELADNRGAAQVTIRGR
jgi:hypothetical protein